MASQIYGSGSTVSLGSGAGAGATYSIVGTDLCGLITVTFGTSPAAGLSFIATITTNLASQFQLLAFKVLVQLLHHFQLLIKFFVLLYSEK